TPPIASMTFFAISVFDICKNLLIFYCFENGSPASTFLIVPRIENMSTVLQDFFETFLDFLTHFDSMKLFSF
ncbi:MAG: hypothetical protein ACLUO7_07650, partial [Streptococcus sp.]